MFFEQIEHRIFRSSAPHRINYVLPVSHDKATGLVADVYQQMARDFQIVPPLTIHSVIAELLAAVWAIARESLIAGPVDRTFRETIAANVSRINECPFCVEVHTAMLHGGNQHAIANALLSGTTQQIETVSPEVARIAEWAESTLEPEAGILRTPPFSEREAPELIGTAVTFHYLNRMVNVFLDKSPLPIQSIPRWLKGSMGRIAGMLFGKRIIGLAVSPGDSLGLLDTADLLPEFAWADSNPTVSGAFSRFSAVLDEVGRSSVPGAVRELVQSHVEAWKGDAPGISRHWVDEAVAGLPQREQIVGRIALLTAIASWQVDEGLIADFRQYDPRDETLIGVTAWSSYVAARRIAGWLAPFRTETEFEQATRQKEGAVQ